MRHGTDHERVTGGAPHRTNDLDGDKHRRTLHDAETALLTQRGTGKMVEHWGIADQLGLLLQVGFDPRNAARPGS